jgi:hypothetical protein
VDITGALNKIRTIVNDEKKQLDSILKGAELLAEMLSAEKQSGNKGKEQIEYSEPGLETARGTGERHTI